MTTTVLIGIQGNKNVKLKTPHGDMLLKPGHWITMGIHGEQTIVAQEHGEFLSVEAGFSLLPKEAPPAG